jgi:hypothetical protein
MKFRRLREMRPKATVSAPGQAREMRGPTEELELARQVAVLARRVRAWEAAQRDPDFEPIAGVGLEQFAAVSRGIAAFGHDQSKLFHVTAAAGISVRHWEAASQGWQDRIQGNHAVARRFNQFYREEWA